MEYALVVKGDDTGRRKGRRGNMGEVGEGEDGRGE